MNYTKMLTLTSMPLIICYVVAKQDFDLMMINMFFATVNLYLTVVYIEYSYSLYVKDKLKEEDNNGV